VEVRKPGSALWKEGIVVKARPSDLLVRYAGRQQQFDEWMPFTPENVAASGDHIRARASLSRERRFSVKPNDATTRLRVIQTQNPRFQHYRDSLAAHGLRLHAVEGDGNCLFRSVSHQIYSDDAHHGLVRRFCMDYMESEKEYFEPYVVGDMAAFLRYVEHKRRDGIWGDDPEIQAMCELYDRPAEVYAYDPTSGFRKLRTFHENRSLSRTRPPIRCVLPLLLASSC
jgi:OTU domain-containing protein 5